MAHAIAVGGVDKVLLLERHLYLGRSGRRRWEPGNACVNWLENCCACRPVLFHGKKNRKTLTVVYKFNSQATMFQGAGRSAA